MQAVRQTGTRAERALAAELDRDGVAYRANAPIVPSLRRRADFLFEEERLVVFVDGCFWHRCPLHATDPKANRVWWMAKLEVNRLRDLDTNRRLRRTGWKVLRVWEHEDPPRAARRVLRALGRARQRG